MDDDNKFLKIFALVAFVAFAAVSCWSTTESLFLSLENAQIPKWVFWIAVVGLYVLTSICFKMVIEALNQDIYVEHRAVKFAFGLLGVIVLWIAFSMPTNSHTFFYKQMAKKTAVEELKYVDVELEKLTNENAFKSECKNNIEKFSQKVLANLDQLKEEIKNYQQPGFGPESERVLAGIEDLFGLKTGTILRRKTRNITKQEINDVREYYDNVVKEQLNIWITQHEADCDREWADHKRKVAAVYPIREGIMENLGQLDSSEYDKELVLKNSRMLIERAYAELKTQLPNFERNESHYSSDRLVKVTKVWGDYFNHRFKDTDYTLWYWILLAVIVDIAAFAFFSIAFKKED